MARYGPLGPVMARCAAAGRSRRSRLPGPARAEAAAERGAEAEPGRAGAGAPNPSPSPRAAPRVRALRARERAGSVRSRGGCGGGKARRARAHYPACSGRRARTKMAAPLEEYEKEAGCVPILHPEVSAPRRAAGRARARGAAGTASRPREGRRRAGGRGAWRAGGCAAAPRCRPGCARRAGQGRAGWRMRVPVVRRRAGSAAGPPVAPSLVVPPGSGPGGEAAGGLARRDLRRSAAGRAAPGRHRCPRAATLCARPDLAPAPSAPGGLRPGSPGAPRFGGRGTNVSSGVWLALACGFSAGRAWSDPAPRSLGGVGFILKANDLSFAMYWPGGGRNVYR